MSRLLYEIKRGFLSKLALRIEHVDPTQVHNRTFTFFGLDIQDSGTSMDYEDKINEVAFLPSSLNEAIQGKHILFYLYLASPQGQDHRNSVSHLLLARVTSSTLSTSTVGGGGQRKSTILGRASFRKRTCRTCY